MSTEQEQTRPFRLWNPSLNNYLRWRCYKYPRNAHLGALIEARWSKPNTVIEVIDIRNMRLLGQYKRTPTSVAFTNLKREDNGKDPR